MKPRRCSCGPYAAFFFGVQVYPWFCRDARGWGRVLPGDVAAPRPLLYPLTQSVWLHRNLLEWFDGLFPIGGISGRDFLLCRNAVFGGSGSAVRRSPFFAVYLHFAVVESLLDTAWMAGFFGAPSAVRLRLSGRAVDRSLALQLACQQLFPVLRQAFEDRWVTTHPAWCGPACASSIPLDLMRSSSRMGAASPNAVSMGAPPSVCGPRAAGTSPAALQSIVRRRSICCRFMLPACATAGGRGAAFFRRLLFVVVFLSGGIHTHLGGSRVQRGLRLHKCGRQRRMTATPAKPAASAPTSVAASFVRPSAVALSCFPSTSMWLNFCRR